MCKQGEVVVVMLAHTTSRGTTHVEVDACIAPLVRALNEGNIQTVASCCGHGRIPGNIALEDGRELMIVDRRTREQVMEQLQTEEINGRS
ncbi:hypothetical protein LLH00_05820 [bacterium]|nr:hypothetical protein [bacterium]